MIIIETNLKKAIENYRPMLLRLAYSCTGNFSDSEDIVQNAFVKLYLCRKNFPTDDDMRAWLIRVTVNMCKNHVKSWRVGKRSEFPDDITDKESFHEETVIREALDKLKPIYRAVIYLYYYEGFSVAEIGKNLKISTTLVTTRLQRGRSALRKILEE